MQRFILTGAPGAGKTVLLRRLELAGFPGASQLGEYVVREPGSPKSFARVSYTGSEGCGLKPERRRGR